MLRHVGDIAASRALHLLTGFEAVLLTSAALTAEVGVLKQDLERSEQELGHAKKQLEDKEGPRTRWQP